MGKSTDMESKSVVARCWGEEGMETDCFGYGVFFWGDDNVSEVNRDNGCTIL